MIQYRSQLVELMKTLNLPLVGVEVGVATGCFSRDLLNEGMEKLYSVDAWQTLNQKGDGSNEQEWHDKNYEEAMRLLTPFGERSVVLRGLSHEMAKQVPDNSLGLAYFDGAHDYGSVMSDLNDYFQKVVDGGIIAGHDFLNVAYGVRLAVEEFCAGRYEVHITKENKDEDAGFWFQKK